MSENKVPLVLTAEEIIKALRCCTTSGTAGGGCRNCPLDKKAGRLECSELICLMAADRIGELLEELRKFRDATDGICQREQSEMVRLAAEMNTALNRGLHGANRELFARMQEHQTLLTELGRASVIQVDPVGESAWRCVHVEVEGTCVFGERDGSGG